MDKVALLSPRERSELFQQAAARRGIRTAIVEKDFWVCWILKKLFSDDELRSHLVFNGGTSLSKVFRLIDRFSEDVDLVLDWRLLGFGDGADDPRRPLPSKTQQDRFKKLLNQKAVEYIRGPLLARIAESFSTVNGVSASIDSYDPHVLHVDYPAAHEDEYVLPRVRLEIGPLASWVPSNWHVIRAYAADEYPAVFDEPDCPVVAIAAERTFWEKATILHKEAHREGLIPSRHSRHYYDLFMLARNPVRETALAAQELLTDVVAFKSQFYPSAWARYDLAKPDTFVLTPGDSGESEQHSGGKANSLPG